MLRWKEGAQLVPSSNGLDGFLGCYFPSLGEYDMNGDGKMDLCLWSGTKPATTCDAMLEIGEGKDAGGYTSKEAMRMGIPLTAVVFVVVLVEAAWFHLFGLM